MYKVKKKKFKYSKLTYNSYINNIVYGKKNDLYLF